MKKKAFITGINGQDGSYLAETIGYMAANNSSSTHSGLPYAALVSAAGMPTDDSAGDFSPYENQCGGKMSRSSGTSPCSSQEA